MRALLLALLLLALAAVALLLFTIPRSARPEALRPAAGSEPAPANVPAPPLASDAPAPRTPVEAGESAAPIEAAQGFDPTDAQWVEVRIDGPAGLPSDERAWVVALDEALFDGGDPGVLLGMAANVAEDVVLRLAHDRAAFPSAETRWAVRPLDAQGAARVPFPADAERGWVAVVGRYRRPEACEVALPARAPYRLEPRLGAWLTGRVVAGAGSAPGARPGVLWLARDQREGLGFLSRVELDGEGRFECLGLAPSASLGLLATAEGAAEALHELAAPAGAHVQRELVLEPGGRVAGTVVGEEGEPVAGVAIVASWERAAAPSGLAPTATARTTSDARGAFALHGLPLEGSARVAARPEGWHAPPAVVATLAGGRADDVRFTLARGVAIRGRVRWVDGTPAAGAGVSTALRTGGRVQARADEEGRFVLGALEADERYDLAARLPAPRFPDARPTELGAQVLAAVIEPERDAPARRGRGRLEDVPAGARDVELALEEDLTLTGRVVDERREPVRRFVVRAWPLDPEDRGAGSAVGSFESDAGSFVLEGLVAGPTRVEVEADGYAPAEGSRVRVELPQREGALELVLRREAQVRGVVLDPLGHPVPRARVAALGNHASFFDTRPHDETFADGQGRFRLGSPPRGAGLVAEAEGWAPSAPLAVEAAPGAGPAEVVLRLRRGATVTGEVRDAEGRPLGGVPVAASTDLGSLYASHGPAGAVRTGADGSFRIAAVRPGTILLSAHLDRSGDRPQMEAVEAADEETLFRRLDVHDGEEVHVVLVPRPRRPVRVEGVVEGPREDLAREGQAIPAESPVAGSLSFAIDGEGRFALTVPRPGEYTFLLVCGAAPLVETHEVPAADAYRVRLAVPSGRVEGRVLDGEGSPLADIPLSLAPSRGDGNMLVELLHRTRSDSDGRFAFEHVSAGDHVLRAAPAFLLEGEPCPFGARAVGGIAVEPGATATLELRLAAAGTLAGTVTDETGAPVAGATVFVRGADGLLLSPVSDVRSDASGAFVHAGIPAEPVALFARTELLCSAPAGPFSLRPGERAEVALELRPGARLAVRVVDAQGPVRARLELTGAGGAPVPRTLTEEDAERLFTEGLLAGATVLGPLLPGTYEVRATDRAGREARATLRLEAGETREVVLDLE